MDNIKTTNDCGIYLDEFCNRETLNIDIPFSRNVL